MILALFAFDICHQFAAVLGDGGVWRIPRRCRDHRGRCRISLHLHNKEQVPGLLGQGCKTPPRSLLIGPHAAWQTPCKTLSCPFRCGKSGVRFRVYSKFKAGERSRASSGKTHCPTVKQRGWNYSPLRGKSCNLSAVKIYWWSKQWAYNVKYKCIVFQFLRIWC